MIEVLEDVVSADGKNTKKIKKRIGKGIGIISEITNILEKTTLGENYFTTALLLRESLFLNDILTNSEVWYGLTKQDIEDLDVLLLRKFLNTKISVPTESLYLELVCLNINTIIMARRNQLPPLLGYKEKKKKYCPKFSKLSGNTVPQEIGVNK